MKCEICGSDPEVIVILPIHRLDGCLNTLACWDCARQSEAYCLKHDVPHLGFVDGSTACRNCIEEELAEHGKEIAKALQSGIALFQNREPWLPLFEWAKDVVCLTGQSLDTCIARAVVTLAKRRQVTASEIIQEVINQGNPNILLPQIF